MTILSIINQALVSEVKRMEDKITYLACRNTDYRTIITAIKDYIDAGGDNIIIIEDLIKETK